MKNRAISKEEYKLLIINQFKKPGLPASALGYLHGKWASDDQFSENFELHNMMFGLTAKFERINIDRFGQPRYQVTFEENQKVASYSNEPLSRHITDGNIELDFYYVETINLRGSRIEFGLTVFALKSRQYILDTPVVRRRYIIHYDVSKREFVNKNKTMNYLRIWEAARHQTGKDAGVYVDYRPCKADQMKLLRFMKRNGVSSEHFDIFNQVLDVEGKMSCERSTMWSIVKELLHQEPNLVITEQNTQQAGD